MYVFTANHEAHTLALAKSEIRSFFRTLQPLRLTLSEYILLVNVQLIPILSYRLMAHPLALIELEALQAMIWQNIAHDPSPDKANRISRLVSPKDRYSPRHQGGLGLRHFTFSLCMALVNTAIRYLYGDGPDSTKKSFSEAMLSTTHNPIQDTVMDACQTIGHRYHSTGFWASCPPSLFLPKEKVQVRFLATKPAPQYSKFGNRLKRTPHDLGFHLGTATGVHTESATLQFSDGTTHTIKDPGLRRNEKEYTFQNPAISVRPQLAGHHELLNPPLLHPQEYILNPPPPGPHGGVLLYSSLHGELYRLTDEPHSFDPDDPEEWGCEAALALLLTSSPDRTWVYLDGSAGALGYGSVATLFFPNGQSSERSEFLAAIMFIRWALASHPHLTFAVLGDNLHVISVLSPSTPPDLPSRSPAGTWESSLQSIQASLRPGMIQGPGWIKGHAGFVGNEISDAYSKWATHVMIWDPSLLPPPPDRLHIQRPPLHHTQTDYHLNQAPPPLPKTRKHPHTVQLPFLQPHFMVPRPPFQMVLRKFQHGAVCFPRRPAPSPLPRMPRPAPNECYLFRLTLPNVRTPGAKLRSVLALPLHHGGVPMVVRDHTSRGEAQFRPGACLHVPVHQTHNSPLRLKKTSTLS